MPDLRLPPAPSDISLSLMAGWGELDWMSERREELTCNLTMEDLRGLTPPVGAEDEGCGEPERGVEVPVGWEDESMCFFLCFLRVDSFPLVSEADRLGEPARLRWLCFLWGSVLLGRPMGVVVPFVEAPEAIFGAPSFSFSFNLASSSFLRSSSACFSSSVVSSPLCSLLAGDSYNRHSNIPKMNKDWRNRFHKCNSFHAF